MTEEELHALHQQYQQRLRDEDLADNDYNQSSSDISLQSQSEESKSVNEEQAHESLIAQWQQFFMRVYASWCRK